MLIDFDCRSPAVCYSAHHQRLAAAHITCSKQSGSDPVCPDINIGNAAPVQVYIEQIGSFLLAPDKSRRNEQ